MEAGRKLAAGPGRASALEALATAGDGAFYFLDQFVWLAKAGFISKAYEKRLATAGAACEALGYVGSLSVHFLKLQARGLEGS